MRELKGDFDSGLYEVSAQIQKTCNMHWDKNNDRQKNYHGKKQGVVRAAFGTSLER